LRLSRVTTINDDILPIQSLSYVEVNRNSIESIDRVLSPGVYLLEATPVRGNTNYRLEITADDLTGLSNIGVLNDAQTFSGQVGNLNPSDLFRFNLNTLSNVDFRLTGLSADADLRVARDLNRNGKVDNGEEIALAQRSSNFDEQLTLSGLAPGDYLAEVFQFEGDTHYRLGLTSRAVDTPTSSQDLSGQLSVIQAPDLRLQDTSGRAEVQIFNRSAGDNRPVTVQLYASTDRNYDSNDELLARQTFVLPTVANGSTRTTLNFGLPTGIAPGSYYLIARIDSDQVVAETNETNNILSAHVSAPGTNAVLDWDATLLNAIQQDGTAPPLASRHAAIMHTAIYDAVNGIAGQYRPYFTTVSEDFAAGASPDAAIVQAAFQVLSDLYPGQRANFVEQRDRSLAEIPDGSAKTRGIAVGQFVADRILAARRNDGSGGAQDRYLPSTTPGSYQPTRLDNFVLYPEWGEVTPFIIPSVASFRTSGPPSFGGSRYGDELNEVQQIGGINSSIRTADQSEVAAFWAYDRPDTFRPTAQWNQIAEVVALQTGTSLLDSARVFAAINVAQADAGIVAWDAKYTYNQLRPITAIRQADSDGNPETIGNPNWQSLLPTPPFPDYVAGHSTFGAAAAGVLTFFYGDDYQLSVTSQEIPGISRSFSSFEQAAIENGLSRIYGGVHVTSADQDGLLIGQAVADYVTRNAFS
jgi:hypothetical protein